jgi:DNA-binding LacI/PurR family transcriptional regulator
MVKVLRQPPKIADVARRAGVSTATVSRVLNQTAKVNDETAARVRQAINDLGYVPQAAARNLASHKTNTIGLLIPQMGSDFFFPILRGIEAAARQAGFNLLVGIQPEQNHRPGPGPLGNHNTDGLLVFGSLVDHVVLAKFAQQKFPVVLLYHSVPEGSKATSILIENRNGSRRLVEHLIHVHGRRQIAFLRGPRGHQDSDWREKGYRLALTQNGIEVDPKRIANGLFSEEGGYAAVETLLSSGMAIDAIFAADDASAIGAMSALKKAGLRIPQDIAVVGFDDITPARYIQPPLTTVRAPTEEVGAEAVRQLVRLIHGESADTEVLLHTELVIRQSCGCL